jgi:hypothetical protein
MFTPPLQPTVSFDTTIGGCSKKQLLSKGQLEGSPISQFHAFCVIYRLAFGLQGLNQKNNAICSSCNVIGDPPNLAGKFFRPSSSGHREQDRVKSEGKKGTG